MGPKPKKRVLVVEDEPGWQRLIGDLLREVADTLNCDIEVVTVTRFAEALNQIRTSSYDCITVDNKLLDGKMAKTLLDRIAGLDYRVPVIVISGTVNPGDVRDFFKDYEIEEFFWKDNFKPRKFKNTVARIIGDNMDWDTIIRLAASTVAMSAASAAGKKLVETAPESMKGMWQWIRETISRSDNESAKQVWERFEKDPESNKKALVAAIRQLSQDDDTILRGYVEGLVQEVQIQKGAHLFSLLDNRYTFNDLKRICSRVSLQWEDELGSNYNKTDLATWVINYAPTRNKQQDLIAAMLEVNPTVMLQQP